MPRNLLVNSNFEVWQRGSSFSSASSAVHTADRWKLFRSNMVTGATVSRAGSIALPGSFYAAIVKRSSGDSLTNKISFSQTIPENIYKMQGKLLVLSFWAKRGTTFSSAGNILTVTVGYWDDFGVAIESGVGTVIFSTDVTLTTSFQRFIIQVPVIPSDAYSLYVEFNYIPTGTAANSDLFQLTQVQIEEGPYFTQYEYKSYEQELLDCQYYCETSAARGSSPTGSASAIGNRYAVVADTTNNLGYYVSFKVKKTWPTVSEARVTLIDTLGNVGKVTAYTLAGTTITNVTATVSNLSENGFLVTTSGTACIGYRFHYIADFESYYQA